MKDYFEYRELPEKVEKDIWGFAIDVAIIVVVWVACTAFIAKCLEVAGL